MEDSSTIQLTRLEGIGYKNNLKENIIPELGVRDRKEERELIERLTDYPELLQSTFSEDCAYIKLLYEIRILRNKIYVDREPLDRTKLERIYNSLVNEIGNSNETIMFLLRLFSEKDTTLRGYYSYILFHSCSHISPNDSLMRRRITETLDELCKKEKIPFIKIELLLAYAYCDSLDKTKELLKQQLEDCGGENGEVGREIMRKLSQIEEKGIENIL